MRTTSDTLDALERSADLESLDIERKFAHEHERTSFYSPYQQLARTFCGLAPTPTPRSSTSIMAPWILRTHSASDQQTKCLMNPVLTHWSIR